MKDFESWSGTLARNVPMAFNARYRTALSMTQADQPPVNGGILTVPIGKGLIVITFLSIDEQLTAANPSAARLMINLLSAGLRPEKGN
jgi:hypothetical protein